jgi:hypothetical protein
LSISSRSTQSSADVPLAQNADGNARITGSIGAATFVLLFAEGLTVLRVKELISWHVFFGVLLIPFVAVKIASTTYRFARYYSGRRGYVEKGPPPIVLRVLGPVVSVTTVAVLVTGIGAVLENGRSGWLVDAHKVSFIIWFAAMTLHVIGHALETPALAFADWRRSGRSETSGAPARLAVLAVAVAVGVPLAVASLGWAHRWQQLRGR